VKSKNAPSSTVVIASTSPAERFAGLDLLSTAVLILDREFVLMYANAAAENLFAFSQRSASGHALHRMLPGNAALFHKLEQVVATGTGFNENEMTVESAGSQLHVSCVATPMELADSRAHIALEFHQLDQHLKITREEKIIENQQLNRELIRNLAHEIKNPLGGIRGSAQLLERELGDEDLREYTQVIIKEADRLQALMDRLLTPHRMPKLVPINIHEVLERVRTLVLAEFPDEIRIRRDYDTSLPELIGDQEQLIQALLNVARNAAQAMNGRGEIRLVTRIARQVTLAKQRHRHAVMVQIVDNGPGVPESLRDKVFYPLVSGREGGTGLGLSLAQNFINQHLGVIEFETRAGETRFTVVLPIRDAQASAVSGK
jgi:two-component system, NtrC family, nitrogen regulation sensor histidine kinase GlnL